MWYFMAGMEQHYKQISGINCDFGLMTFYKLNQKQFELAQVKINHILIDSGAYSYRFNKKDGDFDSYFESYLEFVKANKDNPKIIGFFELDIDSLTGYEKVLEYRRRLEEVSDKIIPVWHQRLGIKEFYKICEEHSGRRVAVGCVGWHDMIPSQLNMFINVAHKYNCKIHILGMTNKEVLNNSNLGLEDSFDSVGWALCSAFSNIKINTYDDNTYIFSESLARLPGVSSPYMNILNYLSHRKIQEYYKNRDQSVKVN